MWEPEPWQKEFVDAIARGDRVVFILPPRHGKSAKLLEMALELALRKKIV